MSAADLVAAGFALMDQKNPGWWRADAPHPVDPDGLVMHDRRRCVVGQAHGGRKNSYDIGLRALGLSSFGWDEDARPVRNQAASFGFTASRECGYRELEAAWAQAIRLRRGTK